MISEKYRESAFRKLQFDVIDLGKTYRLKKFVETACEKQVPLVGLSALYDNNGSQYGRDDKDASGKETGL